MLVLSYSLICKAHIEIYLCLFSNCQRFYCLVSNYIALKPNYIKLKLTLLLISSETLAVLSSLYQIRFLIVKNKAQSSACTFFLISSLAVSVLEHLEAEWHSVNTRRLPCIISDISFFLISPFLSLLYFLSPFFLKWIIHSFWAKFPSQWYSEVENVFTGLNITVCNMFCFRRLINNYLVIVLLSSLLLYFQYFISFNYHNCSDNQVLFFFQFDTKKAVFLESLNSLRSYKHFSIVTILNLKLILLKF